jgi:hypothetical protein
MLNHSVGSGQHTYEDRGPDCYETPPEAVYALMKVETLPRYIWEPAAGPGSIVQVLRAAGHTVTASDLLNYGCPDCAVDINFLKLTANKTQYPGAILTNPPYKDAEAFVEQALALCPKVIMLLRLAFLESEKRRVILEESGLVRVHVFRNRLPMMHRRGWNGPKASSAIPFAWFVWERGYQGPITLDRISWEHSA